MHAVQASVNHARESCLQECPLAGLYLKSNIYILPRPWPGAGGSWGERYIQDSSLHLLKVLIAQHECTLPGLISVVYSLFIITHFHLLNFREVILMSELCSMYLVLDANVAANVAQDNTHVTHDVSLSIKYQYIWKVSV